MRVRVSGVLLHFSSLPSRYGIGDLGPEAHAFARFLAENGQSVWQFLPLNPTSTAIGNSPYSSPSAFAGNTLFISPELLLEEGFVSQADIDEAGAGSPSFPGQDARRVDYPLVQRQREILLRKAFERNEKTLATDASFNNFTESNQYWLEDYARFVSIKEAHGGAVWTSWPEPLARREPSALAAWDAREGAALLRVMFGQYLFYRQWGKLRKECRRLGLRMVGDLPIYVTHDSADVWANRRFFRLYENGDPTVVAGVPPDYFSATGQRWGNPIYDWEQLKQDDFHWWTRRIGHNLGMFDSVRLDHFRGFAGCWEIPASEETAVNGKWVDVPGYDLFRAVARRLLSLPIIAEDLGIITPNVRELQQNLNFPGMAVLQFGFGGNLLENPHAPFMHRLNQVVYTGTHDNPPSKGWFAHAASWEEKYKLAAYAGHAVHDDNAASTLVRMALASVADMAVIPVQDILNLDMDSRMNTPSTTEGNWSWRLLPGECGHNSMAWFGELASFFGR